MLHAALPGRQAPGSAGKHRARVPHALADYHALAEYGIRTVRDGCAGTWIEQRDGRFDWTSAIPQVDAAARSAARRSSGTFADYGWPGHLDIWDPGFPQRFARFAGAAAALIRQRSPRVRLHCPVNEISFWAWAGGEMGPISVPNARSGAAHALKRQLVACTLAAMDAIRQVDARARFVLADP